MRRPAPTANAETTDHQRGQVMLLEALKALIPRKRKCRGRCVCGWTTGFYHCGRDAAEALLGHPCSFRDRGFANMRAGRAVTTR